MRRPTMFSTAALAVASVCFAIAVVRATTTDRSSVAGSPGGVVSPAERGLESDAATEGAGVELSETGSVTLDALMVAVENDPFQPDRRRPPERYRLPGEEQETAPAPAVLSPPPPFRVLGTVASGGIGLAVMQVEDATPRVLGLGESLLGYTLARVEGDTATLVGQGRTVALTVAPPEQRPEAVSNDDRRNRRANPRDRRNAETQERREEAVREQLLQRMQRMMEERGGVPPDVRFENGRIIIRGRPDTSDAPPRVPRDREKRP